MGSTFVLTDKAFAAAITAVSDDRTLFYTPRQLYYQVMRPKLRRGVTSHRYASVFVTTIILAHPRVW
jgi:hypothetical protein